MGWCGTTMGHAVRDCAFFCGHGQLVVGCWMRRQGSNKMLSRNRLNSPSLVLSMLRGAEWALENVRGLCFSWLPSTIDAWRIHPSPTRNSHARTRNHPIVPSPSDDLSVAPIHKPLSPSSAAAMVTHARVSQQHPVSPNGFPRRITPLPLPPCPLVVFSVALSLEVPLLTWRGARRHRCVNREVSGEGRPRCWRRSLATPPALRCLWPRPTSGFGWGSGE
ncbi:hypothetical protein BKA56DRAFT_309683 [Ilyonectria sp. MPI-CAGE-AT-0026]|nr:hypothetical protein BKA56DRAFT_309683 [Ilyonectria sp. MPI-CAGE-AT-0026]